MIRFQDYSPEMTPSLEEKPNALYIAGPIGLKWLYKISRKLGHIFFLHVPRRLCKFFQSETNGGSAEILW